jgi:hypothetical protein
MSPRPPDFNRLLAAGAQHDFSGFDGDSVRTVRIVGGADLLLPTGRLVARAPGAFGHDAGDYAFVQLVPPGRYPVELIMLDDQPGISDSSVLAAVRLRVRDEPAAYWRMALEPGQDDSYLQDDEYFGYPVDGGTGSFGSPEVHAAMADLTVDDFWPEFFAPDDVDVYVDEETGANLVMFSTGSDGRYGTWVGYTADGEVACFVTDCKALTRHADEDECEYCGTRP